MQIKKKTTYLQRGNKNSKTFKIVFTVVFFLFNFYCKNHSCTAEIHYADARNLPKIRNDTVFITLHSGIYSDQITL